MLYDQARIFAQGGRGGDGCLSFRREAHVPRGGPDGGDGGRGGEVILVCDDSLRDLQSFKRKAHYRADRGRHGEGSLRHGADGSDLVVKVPPGTIVRMPDGTVHDLVIPGRRAIIARGGTGGHGNKRFAGAIRQGPRFAEKGLPGEEHEVELQLKLLADVGLVGLPNAGKSSLIRRISNATPKVADYPFTTLAPVLGTVEAPDGAQLVVADVPGLIEGASEGIGLGHEFLAHLERARLLVHVIDAAAGDPAEQWRTIDNELHLYGAGLDERLQVVVLNKIDLLPEPPELVLDDPRILRVFQVSCATGAGIELLKRSLFELCPTAVVPIREEGELDLVDYLVYRPRPVQKASYRILRTDRGYRVAGRAPTDPDELEAALRAAGVRKGDEVFIGEEELLWA
jgi:GTP-binding protein